MSVETSVKNYKRLGIEIKDLGNNFVGVKQIRIFNSRLLTNKELHRIGREVYKDKHIKPVTHLNIEHVTADWVIERMEESNLYIKDVANFIGIGKTFLKDMLNGTKEIPRAFKHSLCLLFLLFDTYKED